MKRGLVIGKFYPPHLGHAYLINYALDHCDELTVLVCDSEEYTIPATKRQEWLQKIHPTAIVEVIPDIGLDDDSHAWANYTIGFLGFAPDVVFSSEDYGITYADFMDAEHVMVDQARVIVPISATRIRANLFKEWNYLHPVVKADLALRIVIVGAESTGTTTLAQALAEKLHAPWVPEYGRLYSEAFTRARHEWTDREFVHIAKAQQAMERSVASASDGVIICDTNAFATTIWQKRYMNHITKEVADIAANDLANYYFVTGDEIPFVQDGVRDGEHIRHNMHNVFVKTLEEQSVPYAILRGAKGTRLQNAFVTVKKVIKDYNPTKAFERQAAH